MDSLVDQFDGWTKELIGDFKEQNREKARLILREGLDIFRGWVPIDTEQLKQNIRGEFHETTQGIVIEISVKDIDLSYPGKKESINAIVLGLILEKGKGKRTSLKRTKTQDFAAAGSPTAKWFEKAGIMWFERAQALL